MFNQLSFDKFIKTRETILFSHQFEHQNFAIPNTSTFTTFTISQNFPYLSRQWHPVFLSSPLQRFLQLPPLSPLPNLARAIRPATGKAHPCERRASANKEQGLLQAIMCLGWQCTCSLGPSQNVRRS